MSGIIAELLLKSSRYLVGLFLLVAPQQGFVSLQVKLALPPQHIMHQINENVRHAMNSLMPRDFVLLQGIVELKCLDWLSGFQLILDDLVENDVEERVHL